MWVLGGHQTDFARSFTREGLDIADLVAEVVHGTLANARVDAEEVGTVHVGNAFGELFTGQGHLCALPATVESGLWGTPSTRHEAACASGGAAVLAAMAQLQAGHADCALVLGAELERTLPGDQASRTLGAAAWVGHEGGEATYVWPWVFDTLAEVYDERYGLDHAHLAGLAELAFRNARDNPLAQARDWRFTEESFSADDEANPVVHGRVRRTDCSQITDGGAGLVLAGRAGAERWAARHGLALDSVPRILGWGHRTVGLGLEQKLLRDKGSPYVMPHVRQAVTDAYGRAGIGGAEELDAFEVHDCFTPTAYLAIDHLGLTAPGRSYVAVEDGRLERTGPSALNPGGGLIGTGHPVGASGVRMVLDASRQVCDRAGPTQVEGARRVATLNIGGSTASTVTFVVGL